MVIKSLNSICYKSHILLPLQIKIRFFFYSYGVTQVLKFRTEQCGQTNPLIFSMMPITGILVFLQNVNSRLTSPTATACNIRTACTVGPA